jgi:APA family basic amino acid/polyamine antiporter
MTKNNKGLSLFALIMIAIGSTIGSGVFKTPTDISMAVPDVFWMTILWILGGVVSMVGALVFAELGTKITHAGGVYSYLRETIGEMPAFLYGWCLLTVVSSGTIAALIVVFADYMQKFIGYSDALIPLVAAITIVVLTLFNAFSLKGSEWFANIATILKMIGIFGVIIVLLFWGTSPESSEVVSTTQDLAPFNWAKAFVGVLWSYTGWHYASFVSGDAKNPQRDVPMAMILGTLTVTVIYVLCNLGYTHVMSIAEIQNTKTLAADAMEKVWVGSGFWVSILIALSVFGCAGLYILATPRIIQQMSKEGVFFKTFATAHPKFGVPLNAILMQSVWAIVLVFVWGKFEALYTYVTITEWFFLLLTALGFVSWVVLKKKESFSIRSYVFIFLALVFSVVVSWFIIANAQSDNPAVYYGLLVIPVGMVVYYFMKKASR